MKVQSSIKAILAACALFGVTQTAVRASTDSSMPDPSAAMNFVIGPEAGDIHSHAAFPATPNDIFKVSARVRVTSAIGQGLNFFAVQVNFPNGTWAHGGPQLVNGKYQMNWGGLVSRGGGSADYQKEDPASDLQQMQNGPDSDRSHPYVWAVGNEYVLTIERGKRITFPPGEYVFIGAGPRVFVPNERAMWEWKFTLKPADGVGPTQVSTLYDAADRISSFYIWNECGYGSCGKGQSATWSMPVYSRLGAPDEEIYARTLKRF